MKRVRQNINPRAGQLAIGTQQIALSGTTITYTCCDHQDTHNSRFLQRITNTTHNVLFTSQFQASKVSLTLVSKWVREG